MNSAGLEEGSCMRSEGCPRGGCNKDFDMVATALLAYLLELMMLADRGLEKESLRRVYVLGDIH
jgi:hypothetical protein